MIECCLTFARIILQKYDVACHVMKRFDSTIQRKLEVFKMFDLEMTNNLTEFLK